MYSKNHTLLYKIVYFIYKKSYTFASVKNNYSIVGSGFSSLSAAAIH